MEPWRLGAVDARARIRGGRLSAAALTASCLERIHDREPLIQAFAHLDVAAALRQAEACDRARSHAGLAGLPVGVKDICDTADMPTRYGSRLYREHRPGRDAACVARLRRVDAVIPGKTATTEFAGPQPAPTRNPRDPASSPGGSSSGSAGAVADGMLPVAIGTQTAGSIIRPAAFCGIVGLKPSFGLIDTAGVRPAAPSFDTIGTFGRSVADAALLLAALLGDPSLQPHEPFRPRIGFCRTAEWDHADADVQQALESAAALFSRAGALLRAVKLPAGLETITEDQIAVMGAETARGLADDVARGAEDLGAATLAAVRAGAAVTPQQEEEARGRIAAGLRAVAVMFDEIDVLICPSAAAAAPEGLGSTGDPVFNRCWTALGGPCLTLPFTTGGRGLPIGVQVVGRPRDDARALAAALWMETAIRAGR